MVFCLQQGMHTCNLLKSLQYLRVQRGTRMLCTSNRRPRRVPDIVQVPPCEEPIAKATIA